MVNDPYHFEIRRKPGAFDPPPTLFICIACDKEVKRPWDWRVPLYGNPREREPVCKNCASRWGAKVGGPVFNRQNFHTLRQLSAMINIFTWEIENGKRRYR